MEASANRPAPAGGLSYTGDPGTFDEVFTPDGNVRPLYAGLLAEMDAGRLGEIQAEMQVELAERGVEFGPPHSRAPFGVDAFPRIFPAGLWADLEKGLTQRVKALNAFLDDVYTNRRVVEAGVLPARILDEAMHYEPLMEKVDLPVVAQVAGPDLVRGADGEFSVLEDNLRTPSGLAYASVGRPVLEKAYAGAGLDPRPYESTFDLLGRAIRAADPSGQGDPSAALLTDGPISSAWFEHQELGRRLGIPLVSPGDLHPTGGVLMADVDGGQREIRVLYNRSSTERLTLPGDRLTPVGELLAGPMLAGNLAVVNSFGTGVADDKAVHCYVDELISFYLDEEPLLTNAKSYDLGNPEHREMVLARLDEVVVKPRWTFGGQDIVIGPRTPAEQLEKLASAIRRSPERFIAQEMVMLSTHPTIFGGTLSPRHIDLRPYVLTIGNEVQVAPEALTRFARNAGEMIVSSARGGGAKDTWILGT